MNLRKVKQKSTRQPNKEKNDKLKAPVVTGEGGQLRTRDSTQSCSHQRKGRATEPSECPLHSRSGPEESRLQTLVSVSPGWEGEETAGEKEL